MKRTLILSLAVILALPVSAGLWAEDTMKDEEAVRATALDYIQGWYDADGARMERALHPELVKRGLTGDDLRVVNKDAMLNYTVNGMGKNQPGKKEKEITVLDLAGTIATVKVVSDYFIDYLQVGKVRGRWVIINVLWKYKER